MSDRPVSDIAFTPTVKAVQERLGSRKIYAGMEQKGGWKQSVTGDLASFIAERDTLFIGSVSADGQPYIQHRGGPPGFLKVLDEQTLGFADYSGNQQYITLGNLEDNPKAFLFLMDFANRRRIKIWGTAEVIEDDPELMERVSDPDYAAKPQRAFLFRISAWDVNCPQHIKPRFTEEEIAETVESLHDRIETLEAEVKSCCPERAGDG
jgi:predicted pyridoxine 5'-phosphate oxidase superfamily flavin-nucleotide-binding protein